MGIFSRFKDKHEPNVVWKFDRLGLDFALSQLAQKDPVTLLQNDLLFGYQYAYLNSLLEQGIATRIANGYHIDAAHVCLLEEDFADCFSLPQVFNGKISITTQGLTSGPAFQLKLEAYPPGEHHPVLHKIEGPFLRFGENEVYRLSEPQWDLFIAIANHENSPKSEYDNNLVIFEAQRAKRNGVEVKLIGAFDSIEVIQAEGVGVSIEQQSDGSLTLVPAFGQGTDAVDINNRLGQVSGKDQNSVLKVKNKFVLLDEAKMDAVKEIISNRNIPRSQVEKFLKAPTAFLDASLVDLETGFSMRVNGAQLFRHHYFGDAESSGVDWFSEFAEPLEPRAFKKFVSSSEDVDELEKRIESAYCVGATVVEFEEQLFDISDSNEVEKQLKAAKRSIEEAQQFESEGDEGRPKLDKMVAGVDANDEALNFSQRLDAIEFDGPDSNYQTSNLKRQPFPHQDEGVRWTITHLEAASKLEGGGGALLADDMGLGKTFMTLVSIAEWYRRCEQQQKTLKPCLIVAPLSLLENWADEIDQTFIESPFSDVITLQSSADLSKFKLKGASRETLQQSEHRDTLGEEEIRYALKVGKAFGPDRLDMPRRLVLVTYQTLRDYQFSLSRIDWSVVAFDEAQNIKNPNSMATIAAAALKADFKLLASGTPVENSLKDLWSLMNVALPGLLGSWQDYRAEYIAPILAAERDNNLDDIISVKTTIGQQLRSQLGRFMLRRTKESQLKGLPEKRYFMGVEGVGQGSFDPLCQAVMSGMQLDAYDDILKSIHHGEYEGSAILAALLHLKLCSVHPDFRNSTVTLPNTRQELLGFVNSSQKISKTVEILKAIEKRQEKVIVFATSKKIQRATASIIQSVFGIAVDIINGETKAVATGNSGSLTRKAIIERFEAKPGFGVIVMSPVAAGVGLTVVGANNVIHLERHWNPAKEAQATDRVYRIGQTRDVNVYIPMALHPNVVSFDENINILLSKKVDLSDAVVAQPDIGAAEIMRGFE